MKAVCWHSVLGREVIAEYESIAKHEKSIQVHVVRIK